MRFFITTSLFFYSFIVGFSQTTKDSIEFYLRYNRAYKIRNTQPDSAFYWIDRALEIAKSAGKREWLAQVHNLKGILYYRKSDYFQSLQELKTALQFTRSKEQQAKIYINLGNTLSDLNDHYSAKEYYEKSVRLFNERQNYPMVVRALLNLATEEFLINKIYKARSHLKLALYYAHENELLEEEALCLNNLSAMFIKTGQVDSALRYIYQSFNCYEQIENYYGLVDAYLTAIELHLEKKELALAKAQIELADSIIDSLHYLEGKKLLTSEKVNYYLLTNHVSNAQKYFNIYLQLEDSLNKRKVEPMPSFTDEHDINEKTSSSHSQRWTYFQLLIILLSGIFLTFALFKTYRYDKE